MKRIALHSIVVCALLAHAASAMADSTEFSVGVISHAVKSSLEESVLGDLIEASDAENLAFIVAIGIKATDEPCTDKAYQARKALLHSAKNGLIVSPAASDWTECKNENGKSAAIGKLNRLRELFYVDEFSLGATKIPLIRQSMTAKYRSFVENARWEMGNIMFATINLPANNNHYVSDAGRNSEFEDRQVANRDWLQRVFNFATRSKADGIVLFCDANPLPTPGKGIKRDGYAEIRKQIFALAAKFPGKVLIVSGQNAAAEASPGIRWHGNLGELNAGSGWVKLTVGQSLPALFMMETALGPANNKHQTMRASSNSKSATLR